MQTQGIGDVGVETVDSTVGWAAHVESLIHLITEVAPHLDLAIIRPVRNSTLAWRNFASRAQQSDPYAVPPPHVGDATVGHNRHLLSRYVHDAHGVQLLTSTHLAHLTTPLSSYWTITEVAPHRHLVVATDLAPWYADLAPHPDTLTAARHEFAPMLLTRQVITDNPRVTSST